jgi:hypothetical protein
MSATAAFHRGIMHHTARFMCPRAEREWIDAMFAELDGMESSHRAAWTLGAFNIAFSGIRLRAATVPASIWCGIVLASAAVVLFAIGSRSEVEALLMDDDVFLRFAWISGVLLVGLGVLAITWIFNHTDSKPRHRH